MLEATQLAALCRAQMPSGFYTASTMAIMIYRTEVKGCRRIEQPKKSLAIMKRHGKGMGHTRVVETVCSNGCRATLTIAAP